MPLKTKFDNDIFKKEISIGNLLSILTLITGLVTVYVNNKTELAIQGAKITRLEEQQKIQSSQLIAMQSSTLELGQKMNDKIESIYLLLIRQKASYNNGP